MRLLKIILKYCILISFLTSQFSFASQQQSILELKAKIAGNTFPQQIFEDYEFYIINNKVESDSELNFLKKLNPTFETKYLQGLILFRNNNFNKSFNILLSLLDGTPTHYPYYDVLIKTSRITKNESKIENQLDKIESQKHKNYLKAQLAYQKAEYNEAKNLFNNVLKSDSTSFDPLFMQAYSYRNLGDYKTALKYFNKASDLLKKNDPLITKVTIAIGSLFYLSGNYDKANELYKRGLKIATETSYNTEKVKATLNLGMIRDLQGIIDKARINFEDASKLASEIGDKELEATSLTEYAVSYTYTGEKIKAREKYEMSLNLFEELKNKNRFASTAINIGHSYLNIANYKRAIKYYEIGLSEAGENVRTKMLALRGLGDVYTNLSDYSKALDYYAKAKTIAKQMKDVPADAKINIGLGVLYYNLNMPQKALEMLKQSERSLIESENPYLKLEIGQKIGIIYNSLDSLSLAQSYLINSSNMAKRYGDVYSEILSNTFLAEILIKQNDVPAALSLLDKTIATTNSIGYNQLLGVQNLLMGDISGLKYNRVSQIKYVEKAKYHADKSKDFNGLIKANQKLGEIYEQQNEFEKAEEYYHAAINIIDLNFYRLFTKADIQIKFFANYYSVYNSLFNLYLSENNFDAAFEILEKSKAKNTRQNLVNHKLENSAKNDELLKIYYDITWKLNSGLYNDDELTSLINQFEDVKDSIVLTNPSMEKHLIGNNQFSINDIQHNFKSNEYVISYFVGKKDIYAFQL
ncbi:MAG: tetratricopeptide repeat protein, partial [Melioribacteraceae bacterium]|nr:tetratricopeptide repeat protein [Melioribacteraceae bacterium]